jgi:hypothetical protein
LVESMICAGCGLERERLTSLELRERVSWSVLQLQEKERGGWWVEGWRGSYEIRLDIYNLG